MSAPKLPDGFFWRQMDGKPLFLSTSCSAWARNSSSGYENLCYGYPGLPISIWVRKGMLWKNGPIATTREEAQAIMVQLLYLGELAVGPEGD